MLYDLINSLSEVMIELMLSREMRKVEDKNHKVTEVLRIKYNLSLNAKPRERNRI